MLTLSRLKIKRYRNVQPDTELAFDPRTNVLLGQNGTGKTTLLELLSDLLRARFGRFSNEPGAFEYTFVDSVQQVSVTVHASFGATPQPSARAPLQEIDAEALRSTARAIVERITTDPSPSPTASDVVSSLLSRLAADPAPVTPDVKVEVCVPGMAPVVMELEHDALVVKGNADDNGGPALREKVQLWEPGSLWSSSLKLLLNVWRATENPDAVTGSFEAVADSLFGLLFGLRRSNALRFDESLDLFQRIVGPHGPDTVHISLWKDDNGVQAWGDFVPQGLLDLLTRKSSPDGTVPADIGLLSDEHPTELAFLQKATEVMGYASGAIRLSTLESSESEGRHDSQLGEMDFTFRHGTGEVAHHSVLSYGQKRLLTFFYYCAANPEFVIADELVNGLHHRWIEACFEALETRQAFLTSQNPLLLDHLEFTDPRDAMRRIVVCREVEDGRQRHLQWSNLSADEATEFYSAYDAGIQQVGEILLQKGLW